MPVWDEAATLSTCLTLQDISKASQFHNSNLSNAEKITPVLRFIENEKAKGYGKLCLPLTTEEWKERWSQMCLLPTESSEQDKETAARAAEAWRLNPVFTRDEVTITRLGVYIAKKKEKEKSNLIILR
jgi:protein arginine N-methyltransferase 5